MKQSYIKPVIIVSDDEAEGVFLFGSGTPSGKFEFNHKSTSTDSLGRQLTLCSFTSSGWSGVTKEGEIELVVDVPEATDIEIYPTGWNARLEAGKLIMTRTGTLSNLMNGAYNGTITLITTSPINWRNGDVYFKPTA